MEVSADAVDALPTFQLNELVAELGDVGDLGTEDLLAQLAEGAAAPLPGGGEATEAGSRAAADFWRCAQEAGFRALCEALSFSGLQQELPRLFVNGVTVIAPSDAAFAQLSPAARGNFKLVRQLLLAHICPGTHLLEELQSKACAVSLAGQTHAVYARDGGTCVGSARLGRTDVAFEGGIIHEVDSVLVVLRFLRDAHTEQVWKKSLQPSPTVSICGGEPSMTNEFEVHGCLLHNATGQLVPEGLRGHIRRVGSLAEEQIQTFAELCVMTKPPSLAKRRGQGADGTNRYRLLFSLWNSSTLNYVSWQHMSTPLVVRNSFHMLPLEEKNYRRQQQYSRSRGRSTDALVPGAGASEIDESYGATSARRAARCPRAPRAPPPTAPLLPLYSRMGRRCPTRAIRRYSAQFAAIPRNSPQRSLTPRVCPHRLGRTRTAVAARIDVAVKPRARPGADALREHGPDVDAAVAGGRARAADGRRRPKAAGAHAVVRLGVRRRLQRRWRDGGDARVGGQSRGRVCVPDDARAPSQPDVQPRRHARGGPLLRTPARLLRPAGAAAGGGGARLGAAAVADEQPTPAGRAALAALRRAAAAHRAAAASLVLVRPGRRRRQRRAAARTAAAAQPAAAQPGRRRRRASRLRPLDVPPRRGLGGHGRHRQRRGAVAVGGAHHRRRVEPRRPQRRRHGRLDPRRQLLI